MIRVRDGNGADVERAARVEVTVGKEPRYVAISPDDKRAFVTNAVAGTMTAIDLTLAASRPQSARRSTSASSRAASQ